MEFGERKNFGADREMFDAVCADCKQQTKVPFKPDPNKPVYCRECYAKHRPPRRF